METVFTYASPALKFGPGASAEIGYDLALAGVRRVLLVTDPGVAAAGPAATHGRAATASRWARWRVAGHRGGRLRQGTGRTHRRVDERGDRVRPRPDAVPGDRRGGRWLGDRHSQGGQSAGHQRRRPDGLPERSRREAQAPTKALLPLVAVPTTTGTGSESTTICVLDVLALRVKTGISHGASRPTRAVVDPLLTLTQPALVTASCGLDILCHAVESYTARWYADMAAKPPQQRVPYCGSNPISDVWSEKAMALLAASFRQAVRHDDAVAREQMALAATFAGLGFGNAGVHIPHACAYPIAGQVRDYRPEGYPQDEPLVPHGMAVSLTAPAAFAATYDAAPERHEHRCPTAGGTGVGRDALPGAIAEIMRDVAMPSGLAEVGFTQADLPDLVAGAPQTATAVGHRAR